MEEHIDIAQSYMADIMGVSDDEFTQDELIEKLDNSIKELKHSLSVNKGLKETIGYTLAHVLNLASFNYIEAHDALTLVATKEKLTR